MRAAVRAVGSTLVLLSFVGLAVLALGPVAGPFGSLATYLISESLGSARPLAGQQAADLPSPAVEPTPSDAVADPPSLAVAATSSDAVADPPPTVESSAGSLRLVLDEDFIDNRMSWPDNSASTAWLAGGEYRLANREPRRFVSVAAPLTTPVRDVVVSARFRKTGGPPGGGYGVILRDERPLERDGVNQSGRYYVLEVGDRGEVGVWRRESDAWVDLLTWTPSEWVNKGQAPNDIEVRATGSRLTLAVNGVQVASQVDDALFDGGVGVFVGGDGNEVALERFVIQIPADATNTAAQRQQQPPHAQQSTVAPQPAAEFLPITRIVIPSISLDSDVVPARLVEREQNTTWDVPAMKVGHAQATAGAGGAGNAVLVGHVDSRGLGNVFHNLDALRVGDQVEVSSGGHTFRYQVGDVRTVQRNDVSVVQPTQTPSVTLITCTGHWLPLVADFTHRLVVRAELASE